MLQSPFEVQVLVAGKKVREYYHEGQFFIEGKKGSEFTLKFKNNSYKKILVVPSIDALSVIDGTPATKNSSGYIVQPYSSLEIKGWRTSLNDVAKFLFDDKKQSYANLGYSGDVANVGSIAFRVYEEKVQITTYTTGNTWITYPQQPYDWYTIYNTCNSTAGKSNVNPTRGATKGSYNIKSDELAYPGTYTSEFEGMATASLNSVLEKGPSSDFNLGTAFGNKEEDKVKTEEFAKGTLLEEMVIYYSDRNGLMNLGIKLIPEAKIYPSPFADGFCKAPKK